MRTPRVVIAGLIGAALVSGLAACGGKSANGSNSTHLTQQQRLVAAMNAFARCARSHGVPVPDAGVNGQIPGIDALARKYIHTPQGQTVLHACQRELTVARQANDASNAPQRAALLKFTRCMRAHGIPLPDPGPNGDTGEAHVRIDKRSPQVQAAASQCNHFLGVAGGR